MARQRTLSLLSLAAGTLLLAACGPTYQMVKPSYPSKEAFLRDPGHYSMITAPATTIGGHRYLRASGHPIDGCETRALIDVESGQIEHYKLCGTQISRYDPPGKKWDTSYKGMLPLKTYAISLIEKAKQNGGSFRDIRRNDDGFLIVATVAKVKPPVDQCLHARISVYSPRPGSQKAGALTAFHERVECENK